MPTPCLRRAYALPTPCLRPAALGKNNADHDLTGAALSGGTEEGFRFPKAKKEDKVSGTAGKGSKGSGKGSGKGGKGKGKDGKDSKGGKGKGKGDGSKETGDGGRVKISGPNKGVVKVVRGVDSARPSWLEE